MTWTALIADDEPPARKRVMDLLKGEKDIQILDPATDGLIAQASIQQHRPDLLFLDIQMPGLTGFELLKALPEDYQPALIFVTAFEEHAVRAFGVNAVDYLLKPFTKERFRQAVDKARSFLKSRSTQANQPASESRLRRLFIKNPERIVFLKPEDIDWIEAAGNYLVIHAGKENHFLRGTMAGIRDQLPPNLFARISRSALVNLERIREITTRNGQHRVVLQNGQQMHMTQPISELQLLLNPPSPKSLL